MRFTDEMDMTLMKAYRAAGGWVPGKASPALERERLIEVDGEHYRITHNGRALARERAMRKWKVTV